MNYDVQVALWVDGRWIEADERETQAVINPSTGLEIARLPVATDDDLDTALDAASRGFKSWRATEPRMRAAVLSKAAGLIRERSERIATVATIEQGKPRAEALAEALASADLLDFHAGEAMRIYGRVLERSRGAQALVLREPVGPVAAFCAWNFPIMNVTRKISPAIAAGCSVIIKPSEETPGTAIEVLRCLLDAGLPATTVQMVFGEPDHISRRLIASPVTRKLSFTGSVPVGKHLARLATDTMMKTTMELGGHAPVLVFDDCDLDRTLDQLVASKFRNAGQVCVSPTRFCIQDGIYDKFAAGFAERARSLAVGDGLLASTNMGPLANNRRSHAITSMVDDALSTGAKLLAGGNQIDRDGYFFSPTVLGDAPLSARAMQEEPFGPLALLRRFETTEEAIGEANRLPYGLATYCFTENGRRQRALAAEIEAGMVAINMTRLSWADAPFGGVKESGQGSEDGPEGVEQHVVTKSVHIE